MVALVEVLQKRKLKHNKRPQSQPHALENITIALDAIQDDGIKLVNIGKNFELLHITHLHSYPIRRIFRNFETFLEVQIAIEMTFFYPLCCVFIDPKVQ